MLLRYNLAHNEDDFNIIIHCDEYLLKPCTKMCCKVKCTRVCCQA